MRPFRSIWLLVLTAVATACPAQMQPAFFEHLREHNAQMTQLQPAMVTPLVAADPRLIQYYRLAVSHEYTAQGAEATNYGNARGGGVIVARRFEFDVMPPPYIQHNGAGDDGFGDTTVNGKVRLASGNAESGNFELAANVSHCFATGSYKNGARTDTWTPTVAGVKDVGRFAFISATGGTLPTGKIVAQGRTINWNNAMQAHAAKFVWLEVEDNATYYFAGAHDGMAQNFITPGAFYVLRRKAWEPRHSFAVFGAGMQIATSGFHTYNHNLIAEVRFLF